MVTRDSDISVWPHLGIRGIHIEHWVHIWPASFVRKCPGWHLLIAITQHSNLSTTKIMATAKGACLNHVSRESSDIKRLSKFYIEVFVLPRLRFAGCFLLLPNLWFIWRIANWFTDFSLDFNPVIGVVCIFLNIEK